MGEKAKMTLECSKCGKRLTFPIPAKRGGYSVTCTNPQCMHTIHFQVIALKCGNVACGQVFNVKAPGKPGNYTEECPHCHAKVSFDFKNGGAAAGNKPEHGDGDAREPQLGLLPDGSYQYICSNADCRQLVRIPAENVNKGLNMNRCPRCMTVVTFITDVPEEELLKCQTYGCGGDLAKPQGENGNFMVECQRCKALHKITLTGGKVTNVHQETVVLSPTAVRLKLSVNPFFSPKKEYELTAGTHHVGRYDAECNSDFALKDNYISRRSLKIEVSSRGQYRMTVERATNPVLHNGSLLSVGDSVYLQAGDTIRIGKTLITVAVCK